MQRLTWILAALVAWPAAAAEPVEFEAPAQLGPASTAAGEWAIILLGQAGFDVAGEFAAGTVIEETAAHVSNQLPGGQTMSVTPPPRELSRSGFGPGSLVARQAGASAFLLVRGDFLELAIDGDWQWGARPGGVCHKEFLMASEENRYRMSPLPCPVAAGALGRSPPETDVRLHFEARGSIEVEFHQFHVACDSGGDCPSGGHRSQAAQIMGPGIQGGVESLGYSTLHARGMVAGNGTAAAVLMGGRAVDVAWTGWLRLPLATSTCDACLLANNQTLWVEGDLLLSDLTPTDGESRRLRGDLGGTIVGMRVDEGPWLPGPGAAASVGLIALLGAMVRLAAGLVTRMNPDRVLEHPNRRRLHDHIHAEPGATFRELQRGADLAVKSTRHHLSVLKRNGFIVEHGHSNTKRFFPNHGAYDDSWNTVVLLRDDDLARLHAWIAANQGANQRSIVAEAVSWGWPRGTTQHRLRKLVQGHLVEARPDGRQTRYHAVDRAPVPEPSAPVAPLSWQAGKARQT